MQRFVVLLRGINVGGKNKIRMNDLKLLLAEIGFSNIQTYIQSGNIVLDTDFEANEIKSLIESKIKEVYSFEINSIIISKEDFLKVVRNNPFLENKTEELHILFMESNPDSKWINYLSELETGEDKYFINENQIYFLLKEGVSSSVFSKKFLNKKIGIINSARNWKTVLKIRDLLNL